MARRPTGRVILRQGVTGTTYAARFTAYGERQYETLGHSWEGYTEQQAEDALAEIMADVRRGIWKPWEGIAPPTPPDDPTFHVFASEWLASMTGAISARTVEDYTWALSNHLLPFFAEHRLSQITVAEVDRYRSSKLREREQLTVKRPLSNDSINKTIKRLAQVLDVAVEYRHLLSNPASGRRRRLKADRPRRARLEAEQVVALLQVAGEDRALLATAIMAGGPRVSELTALRWRHVSLAEHRIIVPGTKSDASANRQVDLAPDLRDLLAAHKLASSFNGPEDFVFPNRLGTRRDRHNVRTRAFYPAVKRANALLVAEGKQPISPDVTFHSLRRTYASLLAEAGADSAYTKAQIGHKSAKLTLEVYTDVGNRRHGANERVGALLRGPEAAQNGTNGAVESATGGTEPARDSAEVPRLQGGTPMGGDGIEPPTSCL
jgi:integrase